MKILLLAAVLVVFLVVAVLVARWTMRLGDRREQLDKAERKDLLRLRKLEESLLKLSMEHMISNPLALILFDEINSSKHSLTQENNRKGLTS